MFVGFSLSSTAAQEQDLEDIYADVEFDMPGEEASFPDYSESKKGWVQKPVE